MAKRMRSLASMLWDTDSVEEHIPLYDYGSREMIQHLKDENQCLRDELSALREYVNKQGKDCSEQNEGASTLSHATECLARDWPTQPWISRLRKDVANLPRLTNEILPELTSTRDCSASILFDLAKSPKASVALQHAERVVASLSLKYPAVFKIGITSDPVRRWMHPRYGYCHDRKEKWQAMKVVFVSDTSYSAALVESVLIAKFKGVPGCRNECPGGESASPECGPHFAYVVFRILLPPLKCISSGL